MNSALRLRHLCVLLFALIALPVLHAQVIVESKLNRAEIRVGEQARLTTTVTVDRGHLVRFPEYNAADTLVAGIEVVECGKVDTTGLNGNRRLRLSRTYVITSFDSALYALPPMTVNVDGQSYTSRSRLGLKVNTVPVDTVHVDQFESPFTVSEAPFTWRPDLLLLSLLPWPFFIIVVIAAIRLTGHKPIRRKVTIKPPVPPYKKASTALEKLQKQAGSTMNEDDNKKFYVNLTDIIRRYIGERYGFNALEKTTGEIVNGLRGLGLDESTIRQFGDIFSTADFVKFAKQTSTDVERVHVVKMTAALLSTTRDAAQEQPRPIVRYITFSDRGQHRLRVAMWWTGGISLLLGIVTFIFAAVRVVTTYF